MQQAIKVEHKPRVTQGGNADLAAGTQIPTCTICMIIYLMLAFGTDKE